MRKFSFTSALTSFSSKGRETMILKAFFSSRMSSNLSLRVLSIRSSFSHHENAIFSPVKGSIFERSKVMRGIYIICRAFGFMISLILINTSISEDAWIRSASFLIPACCSLRKYVMICLLFSSTAFMSWSVFPDRSCELGGL